MSQRISLSRIIAINWYGFRQILPVDDDILISGATGTGKSALLDLIQHVMLGDHWKPNRAAAGNARGRDLVSYCLGDTNTTRDGKPHYLRTSGASIIALEFTWPGEKGKPLRRETWGMRIEYATPDAKPGKTYFSIPDRLEMQDIFDGKTLHPDDRFRAWIRNEHGNDCLYPRQADYFAEMATARHLHFYSDGFMRTLPKAIAFEPVSDVEKFIRDYILEENPLDVREVREALSAYEEIHQRLERQIDEAAYLRRICAHDNTCQKSRRAAAILKHARLMIELQQEQEKLAEAASEIQRLTTENEDNLQKKSKSKTRAANLKRQLDEARQDPATVNLNQQIKDRDTLRDHVNSLRETLRTTRALLDTKHRHWRHWLTHGARLALPGIPEALQLVDDAFLDALRDGAENTRLTAMQKLAQNFADVRAQTIALLAQHSKTIDATESRLEKIKTDIASLDAGQSPGNYPAYQAIREKLGDRVTQLARLIEVKSGSEPWWPALENHLAHHRWTIIVNNDADYCQALAILRDTTPGDQIEHLLNPSEIAQSQPPTKIPPGSLAEKIEVKHPVARAYVNSLLGNIRCAKDITDLDRDATDAALTSTGHLKQPPIRRRLRADGTVPLTLGKEGLARMRAKLLSEQTQRETELEKLRRQRDDANTWLDCGQKDYALSDSTQPARAAELPQLPELEEKLGTANSTIELLSTPEQKERQRKLAVLETEHEKLIGDLRLLDDALTKFEIQISPHRDKHAASKEKIRTLAIDIAQSRIALSTNFPGTPDPELDAQRDDLRTRFPKWNIIYTETDNLIRDATSAAEIAEINRNNERRALADARDDQGRHRHPQYRQDFDPTDPDNTRWSQRLGTLDKVEIGKSKDLAESRRVEWEKRLEKSVLSELKNRADNATRVIRELRRLLEQPIRKFRYDITQRRDTKNYSAIWRLIDTGLSPADPLANAIEDPQLIEAKNELKSAINEAGNPAASKRLRDLLDYRNYHNYDIIITPADRPNAAGTSLAQRVGSLSGGENQAPFFISMLAAFSRVYDLGAHASHRSQHLGLVVMDEAFSKLSGDGIENCLTLARNFHLQLLMAFPPERLGIMVPHAKTVVVCQKELHYDSKDEYITRIDNIPVIMTMNDALEALS